MSIRINDGGPHEGEIRVPVILPGEVSAEEFKEGKAGRVRMPSGAIIVAGGTLFRQALQNGGVSIDANGKQIPNAFDRKMEPTINGAPGPRVHVLG
jgi:hypothetical protein